MYEKLFESFKKRYPFKVCCPSYIYPEDYLLNVNLLGPFVDEIELLFFEGNTPQFLPATDEIKALGRLADENDISYNVHLPTDLSVTSENYSDAVKNVMEIVTRTKELKPSTYTLHFPLEKGKPDEKWYEKAFGCLNSMEREINKEEISVETLNYNPEFLLPFAEEGYKICLDIGHLFYYGFDYEKTCDLFKGSISIIHLHGVKRDGGSKKDHKGLENLSSAESSFAVELLKEYKGVVSFEVFSFEHLKNSLIWLADNL